jgi:hypothetical protein
MPKVAQYEPNQIAPTVVRQPRAQDSGVDLSPISQGISDIGSAVSNMNERIDTTAAEEAIVKFEREKNNIFFHPETGYFNTQGRDAYDNATGTSNALLKLKKNYSDSLSENARKMFDRVADQHITRSQADIMKHSATGLKVWEVSTIESQVENSLENASLYWNQPDKLKVQRIIGEQSIIDSAELTGISNDAINEKLQTYRSSFAASSIEAALQSSSIAGIEALDKYGDLLEGPQKIKIEKAIETKQKSEKIKSDAQAAILTSARLVNDYENRSEIIEQVNKIEDPELRKKTMSEAMFNFKQKKYAEAEERGTAFEDAEKFIIAGGSVGAFQAQNPEGWMKLSPKQQQSLLSGKSVDTDWIVFNDLMTMPKDELAKLNPSDHFNELAEEQRKTLITAVKSARGQSTGTEKINSQAGRTRTSQTNLAIRQLFGKKATWNKKQIKKVDSFYALVDSEVSFRENEKGSKLTSEEYTNLLSGLTREVVQSGIIFDSKRDIKDIPPEDLPIITNFLRENNIPVTSDNLLKAYQQASK